MEQPVSVQGWEFLTALALGFFLAVFYDILRGIRRKVRFFTGLLDFIFGLALLLSFLWFMIYPGGGLFRFYHLWAILMGAALWLLTLSRWFLRLWVGFLSFFLNPLTNFFKFLRKKAKKYFSIGKNGLK